MIFKQKLLNKLNLSSFEKIERDVDKHSLAVFGLGFGLGSLISWILNCAFKKK